MTIACPSAIRHSRPPMALLRHDHAADVTLPSSLALQRLLPDPQFAARVDASLATWMLHDGSLTDRLARAHGTVRVTPTREGIGAPRSLEARFLGAPAVGGWWIREITLAAGGMPRLRARTLVPRGAIDLQRRLRGLGSVPLGRVLFKGDRLRRNVIRGCRRFGRARDGAWLRLTRYRVEGEGLLVIERLLSSALGPDAETPDGR